MDQTFADGLLKGQVSRRIYELKGDSLAICLAFENDHTSLTGQGIARDVFRRNNPVFLRIRLRRK
jgi:hypothetical protein